MGVDDGANGMVDERGELGATGSDDVCQVIFGDEAALVSEQPLELRPLVLQHGAFRELMTGESVPVGTPMRKRVRAAGADGHVREWLVDLE